MLEQPQGALHDDVLEDGSRGNINGASLRSDDDDSSLERDAAAEVDRAGDGEMVELEDLGDAGDVLLEVGDLLEVGAELDQGGGAEAGRVDLQLAVLQGVEVGLDEEEVGAGLDGEEAAAGDVDAVRVLEVTDGGADGGLELDDGDVRLALLVGGDGFVVGDDLHLELVVHDDALDSLEVEPDVVGVEVLELLDGLEFVDMLLGNLCDFQEADRSVVVDDGTTLDIGLGLIGQLHDVLGLGLNHVLEDAQIDNSSQVVNVGKEDNLDTTGNQLIEDARVVQGLENISVSGWVPIGYGGVE